MPEGAWEAYGIATHRSNKGSGTYNATDLKAELEYGLTDRMAISGAIRGLSIDTEGLIIDGYLPQAMNYTLKPAGVEAAFKGALLTPAKDDFGLATYFEFNYNLLDPNSGQDKKGISLEAMLLAQKYFMDGQLILAGNLGFEASNATRSAIAGLPEGFDWPLTNEVELEYIASTGLSYRFAPNWYLGAELLYETEYETEIGQERWSVFGGPTLHYGARDWWATLTWLPQWVGGGQQYEGQENTNLQLIERTEQEVRLKVGFNF